MKKILIALFTFTSFLALSQQSAIRGTVFDHELGESLVGVTVLVKGTTTGTITDLDGKFTLHLSPGKYDLQLSYISYQTLTIEQVEVKAGEVEILENLRLKPSSLQLDAVVVTAKSVRTTETALQTMKKKSVAMIDGISSAKFKLIGDATAVDAAKRVTGVSVEGGKYVFVRGLGDRYTKTTLNNINIPGLDPDRNTLQMDIFPTNLIDNIVVNKNFTADLPADFTGGLVNIEIKDFPGDKIMDVSIGASYNPGMHFNPNYITYEGGKTDFLGFDDGTRKIPKYADKKQIPDPFSPIYNDQQAIDFINSFNPQLGTKNETSLMDFSLGVSLGNQIELNKKNNKKHKLGYIFSLSYKSETNFYDDVKYGEYQKNEYYKPNECEMNRATTKYGQVGEESVLLGALGGIAYKTQFSKIRFTAMRLQSGESKSGNFHKDNNPEAVGQSGYTAYEEILEYNQRSLTNFLLDGTHLFNNQKWKIDWGISPTISTSDDPDIRRTAFTTSEGISFLPGAAGMPSRTWRSLHEESYQGKVDITKKYQFLGDDAKLKFGVSETYKNRDYEILGVDLQLRYLQSQDWDVPDPSVVLKPENMYPNPPGIYYSSGNDDPNPNEYNSNVSNTGFYLSNEFHVLPNLKSILGVRGENFVQKHTGRSQTGKYVLDNDEVLNSLDFFPSVNFIYALTEKQNLRVSYSKTIARPSFKELSYAQIIDPISDRIFNGGLLPVIEDGWDGNLTETRIDNIDLRWELFLEKGQTFAISGFYKQFDQPIEIVRIELQKTTTEYQPRNVGDGEVIGGEFEFRKNLGFVAPTLENLILSGNLTVVESLIEMTDYEYNKRKQYEKAGENVKKTRQMAGQAPYVINSGLSYNNREKGIATGIFYNMKGQTLSVVGIGLFPDVYEEPFHSVNFSINKRFGKEKRAKVSFKVSNLLAQEEKSIFKSFQATNQIYESRYEGRSFGLGVSYKF